MHQERNTLEKQENHRGLGICYDPESITLIGWYRDEISAHRARRTWQDALHDHFLLEPNHDYQLEVAGSKKEDQLFELHCNFITACARYAFWRITNSQAPEVQYVLETAHIPSSESFTEELLKTPDMCHIEDGPLVLDPQKKQLQLRDGWLEKMVKLFDTVTKKA